MAKRLEEGTFWWPKSAQGDKSPKLHLTPQALAMLTDGIELRQGGKRAWYEEKR